MAFRLACLFLFTTMLSAEEPWGIDAALVRPGQSAAVSESRSPLATGGNALLCSYQQFISPISGPRSHFYPTSSQYAREAIAAHGLLRGWTMACDRLLRENSEDWVYPDILKYGVWRKYDPVSD